MQNESIFELIKSLTKAEKRYFSVYSKRHIIGEKNLYLSLFHEIDKQKKYDEKKIISSLQKKEIRLKHFSQYKHYLYKLILQCLNIYNKDTFVDAELTELILQIKILYRKGLIGQYEKILSKAKQLAYCHQNYLKLLEIFELEKLIILSALENHRNYTMDKVVQLQKEENELIRIKKEIVQFEWMEIRFNLVMVEHGAVRNKEQLNLYKKIIDDPNLNSGKKPTSSVAKISYYETLAIYNSVSRNFTEALRYHIMVKSEFNLSTPLYLEDNIASYVSVLANIIQCAINVGEYKIAETQLQELKNIADKKDSGKAEIKEAQTRAFIYNTLLQLRLCTHTGEIDKGKKFLASIKSEMLEFKGLMGKRNSMLLDFHIAQLYFIEADYKKALRVLNKLLNDPYLKISPQLESILKIFQIMIHLELGNDQLVEYIHNSTHQLLVKTKDLYKFEKAFLNFIKTNLNHSPTSKEFKLSLYNFRINLLEIIKDPFEQRPLDYFNFISWIDSKLAGRPLLDIVNETAILRLNK